MNSVSAQQIDVKALYAALSQPFPAEAIKQREGGGRKMLSYVPAHLVIQRLNESCIAHGSEWSFEVQELRHEGNHEYCRGRLTIAGLGSREHIGVQDVSRAGGEDAIAKGATSDALKKCATLFGVALELYEGDPAPSWSQAGSGGASRTGGSGGGSNVNNTGYRADSGGPPASEAQIGFLRKLGYKGSAEGLTVGAAKALIEEYKSEG